MIALALGLVCWIATMIVVASELTRPLRNVLEARARFASRFLVVMQRLGPGHVKVQDRVADVVWRKAQYLAGCHLCAGTWIALVLTALVHDHTFGSGFVAWVLSALLVKAIAHLLLIAQRVAEAAA